MQKMPNHPPLISTAAILPSVDVKRTPLPKIRDSLTRLSGKLKRRNAYRPDCEIRSHVAYFPCPLRRVLDGPHTLRNLREINSGVVCYFMSGGWYPYTIDELMEMGAIGLVVKPFLAKVLPEIVRECLSTV
jgi:hypothetical protein